MTNQIEYAQVGRAFNERALKGLEGVLPKLTQPRRRSSSSAR